MKKLIAVILLTISSQAHAEGWYTKAELGTVRFVPAADGTWRQDRHTTDADWTGYQYQVGIGYRWDKWSVDAAYQYVDGGQVFGFFESDETYSDPKADHTPGFVGNSTWSYRGVNVGANRYFGDWYLRCAVVHLDYRWVAKGWQMEHSRQWTLEFRDQITTIGIGGGVNVAGGVYVEAMYYPNTSMTGAGVDGVWSLSVGLRR